MLGSRSAWGGVILTQLLSDRMTGIIPTSLFGQALGALESNAKPLTLAQVVGGALIGALVAAFVPWPIEPAAGNDVPDPRRRQPVRLAGVSALRLPALWAGGYVGREVQRLRAKGVTPEPRMETAAGEGPVAFAGMPLEITPTDEFYVVSKNFQDPTVDSSAWTLEVGGMVDRPLTLSYSDLMTRDPVEFVSTLECISNPIGGGVTWRDAQLSAPRSPLSWRLGAIEQTPTTPGILWITVRATDGAGETQTAEERDTLPDGATGYHQIRTTVVEPA